MKNKLIFLPGTLTVVDLSVFFGEEVEIVDEIVDGDCHWKLSNGETIIFDSRFDILLVSDGLGGNVKKIQIPQQPFDDTPIYWVAGDMVFWIDNHDILYAAPENADEDFSPIEVSAMAMPNVFSLLKQIEEAPEELGLWVFRYLDDDCGKVLQTAFYDDEAAMIEVKDYIERCECGAQCHLAEQFVDEILSFIGLPHAESVSSPFNKMVIQPLGMLSMTRLK